MVRIAIVAFSLLVGAMVLTQIALGQTTTPTTTPMTSPTTTVPTSAPSTGFGY